MTDGELLLRYVKDHSDDSFAELVQRHINLIYSAALRQVNGDGHLAEDVTQSVFADLARKASKLTNHPSLTGWLYTTTRYIAANIRRTEQRRALREQQAHTMNATLNSPDNVPDWTELGPVIDEVMHFLDEPDRAAVLMRHFEKRSYAEIGTAIGLSENAARMRVERALDKLRDLLARRGVTSTAAALAVVLTANAVGAAPAHLAAKVMATVGAAGASAGVAYFLPFFHHTFTKVVAGIVVAGAIAVLTFTVITHGSRAAAPLPNTTYTTDRTNTPTALLAEATRQSVVVPDGSNTITNSKPKSKSSKDTNGVVLHLEIVAADSGKPIPMVPVEYFHGSGDKYERKNLTSDRFGILDVIYPTNTTLLELTTHKSGFADTRLQWHPDQGEIIPTNYLLRAGWPVPIGGLVVDPDGHPVAGAKVSVGQDDEPIALTTPQSHEFGYLEAFTDQDGHWQINEIADEMISRISATARCSNYTDSTYMSVTHDRSIEKQLRAGTYVFKLGRTAIAQGLVTDTNGNPIADAHILVGRYSMSGSREGKSEADGTFTISGCLPGQTSITATIPGFAPATMAANLPNDSAPAHIVLKPGVLLMVRVVDPAGNPVTNASIWTDTVNYQLGEENRVQVDFNPVTDQTGRARLENAPDEALSMDVSATGFCRKSGVKIRPDGTEHVITLNPSLVVHGTVTDADSGQPIPKFRLAQGWPINDPIKNTTSVHWSTISRFWLDFAGGAYSHSFDEPVLGGVDNPQYVLKFMADGYSPFVSRVISANEGNVELDVTLKPAVNTTVTVFRPDGRVAPGVDIGLVSAGSAISLGSDCIDRHNIQNGASVLCADGNGTFVLAGDDSVTKVIAISPDGFGESTPAALAEQPYLQLQPWGGVDATCLAGGQPVPNHVYGISFVDVPEDSLNFDLDYAHFTTDAQGRISIPHAPPGHLALTRLYTFSDGPHSGGWSYGRKTAFDVQPGQTTTVDLGGTNYVVTAHLKWAAGLTRQPGWNISAGTFAARTPNDPPTPSHPATEGPDNIVSSDELAPGDYDMSVTILDGPLSYVGPPRHIKQVATGSLHFTLPADPGTGNIDLGDIELKPVQDTQ